MRRVTRAALAAIAMATAAAALAAPANAQSLSFGVTVGDPYAGGYVGPDPYGPPPAYAPAPYDDAYGYGYDPYGAVPYAADPYAYAADPYAACATYDYYNPPWGYPPDFCNYQVWQEPIYVGGLWYSGPTYYRTYGGERMFWLNGGWRPDEWRGARPSRIDWGRNRYWSGSIMHGRVGGGERAWGG